jgi:hypothetical protein
MRETVSTKGESTEYDRRAHLRSGVYVIARKLMEASERHKIPMRYETAETLALSLFVDAPLRDEVDVIYARYVEAQVAHSRSGGSAD